MKRFLSKFNNKKNLLILSLAVLAAALTLLFWLKTIFFKPEEIARAKVAIVLDDWGYNLRYLNLLEEIDAPLTISILPNLRYSSKIAEIAKDSGKEVILHLPLEPEREGRTIRLEEYTIITGMPEDEVRGNFARAISCVPYICGVSNHMGSRATKDNRLMSLIFAELKKRDLFFLDNLVTEESICRQLAGSMKVKFVSRDFFLDNLDDYEYIKKQFRKLCESAEKFGQAVGIGHAKRTTLKMLKEEIPLMQAKGIKFVFVSDLVK